MYHIYKILSTDIQRNSKINKKKQDSGKNIHSWIDLKKKKKLSNGLFYQTSKFSYFPLFALSLTKNGIYHKSSIVHKQSLTMKYITNYNWYSLKKYEI